MSLQIQDIKVVVNSVLPLVPTGKPIALQSLGDIQSPLCWWRYRRMRFEGTAYSAGPSEPVLYTSAHVHMRGSGDIAPPATQVARGRKPRRKTEKRCQPSQQWLRSTGRLHSKASFS